MFTEVLTAACLLLMARSGVEWATVDSTRGATGQAEKRLRAATATTTVAGDGTKR